MVRSTPVARDAGLTDQTAKPSGSALGPLPSHVLVTKLFIPHPPPTLVARPRLIERLNEGLRHAPRVTLVSAPAGFGKTTLISEWVHQKAEGRRTQPLKGEKDELGMVFHPLSFIPHPFQVAWLSLDAGDSDPTRFLTYLVAAVQTIAPTIGAGLLSMLQSAQPPPTDVILTVLLNEITTLPDRFLLVLDDYHVIDAKPVDLALSFLVERLPPQMRLVITTREDPQLPLARLRARGQLTELRAADLRFTPGEAATFLNQTMGLNLSPEDITALEDRTEGWIAGLQLAALSMQGREDMHGFIRAFAGDHRYIVDYLVEEVLQRQPEQVRSFLLQTAILDRLSGALCDAVLGKDEGGRMKDEPGPSSDAPSFIPQPSSFMLDHLERGNFFVVPLDDRRHWFRYHHLFADVLRAHLMAEQPDQVATLHRRASQWYEQHGSPADAIRHALAAADFERVADLVEQAMPDTRRSRQEVTLLGWLQALPDELLHYRPVLSVEYVGVLLSCGEFERAAARLRDAERWLDTTAGMRARPSAASTEMVVMDEEAFRRLPASIALYQAGLALGRGNIPETVTYARRVLDLVAEDEHLLRGGAAALLGLASWTLGDLEAAHRSYSDGMAHLQLAGNISDVVGGAVTLAEIRITQGRLREAMRIYERGLQLAMEQGAHVLRGAADMHVGMSDLHREYDDLPAATQRLQRGMALGEHMGLPKNPCRWRVAMARLREAEGDLDGALDLLDEAEPLYMSDFSPTVRPISALRTRVWLRQGKLGEVFDWAREQGLSVHDDLSYVREFEHMTLARALLARSKAERADQALLEALGLLERLLHAAEEGERTGSVIEILVLQALAHQIRGDTPAALAPLQRALALAEPEGYVRMFVDEGEPMAELLRRLEMSDWRLKAYSTKLLAAFSAGVTGPHRQSPIANRQSPVSSSQSPLVEPLSERELEVLRLLGTDLDGPDIARELMVSLNTLRTHTKNIYSKLGVNSRRTAVRRAEELHLL